MLLYVHRHHEDYYCITIKDREPGTATLTFTQLMISSQNDQNDSYIKMAAMRAILTFH